MTTPDRHVRRTLVLGLILKTGKGYTFTDMADTFGGARGLWGFTMMELERQGHVKRLNPPSWLDITVTASGKALLNKPYQMKLPIEGLGHRAKGLHPDGGTRFKKAIRTPDAGSPVLKSGAANVKLGKAVTKGRHAGRKMFSLTLEEGRTCPPCDLASVCYGGNMHLAHRYAHGEALENAVRGQVAAIGAGSMLVRLHVLGDFYSLAYARMWAEELDVPVFGYTHHHPFTTMGRYLFSHPWERFSVRKSFRHGAGIGAVPRRGAVTIDLPEQAAAHDAIICPVQTGAQKDCAHCGLCWNTEQNIAFLTH